MFEKEYQNEADIPAEVRHLFVASGGKFVLIPQHQLKTTTDVETVQEALRKEREDHAEAKNKLRKLGDRNVDEILADIDKIDEYKLAADGKIDEEKIEQIVQSRVKPLTGPLERQIAELTATNETLTTTNTTLTQAAHKRTIADEVRLAATKLKVNPQVVGDIEFMAGHMFSVNEDGKAVNESGLSPEMWLTDQQQNSQRAYWWGETTGSGARGGNGDSGQYSKNPWSKEHWNMTEQGKIIAESGEKAEKMASAAGVDVNAVRPAEK